jgi:solute:Na+ symporter, SSS family
MLPDFGDWSVAVPIFIVPLTVQWWSAWYPGSEPGGGSYIAQRMLASRSERDAMAGTLFFNAAHYALRPWPWLLVALCSMLVFPEVADIGRALPHVDPDLLGNDMAYPAMLTFLPAGLLGLVVAGLLSAYVSTISTHLNWGTSYLVQDFYRRFLRADRSEAHYVMMSRLVTALLMIVAALVTLVLESARGSFNLLLSIGAGTGLLYLLRWFWWRINAWSEVAAMASSFVLAVTLFVLERQGVSWPSHLTLIGTVLVTTVIWVVVAYTTRQTDPETLRSFYRLARPAGPGWAAVRAECGDLAPVDGLNNAFLGWALGCVAVYSALFGTGHMLLGNNSGAVVAGVICIGSTAMLWRLLPRLWTTS